jgi:hypothetical protein
MDGWGGNRLDWPLVRKEDYLKNQCLKWRI